MSEVRFVVGNADAGLREHLDDKLSAVQDAMVKCQGAQCGFCTPGFVVSMYDQLNAGGGSLRLRAATQTYTPLTNTDPQLVGNSDIELRPQVLHEPERCADDKRRGTLQIGGKIHIDLPFVQRNLVSSRHLEPGATGNAQSPPMPELHQHRVAGDQHIPHLERRSSFEPLVRDQPVL